MKNLIFIIKNIVHFFQSEKLLTLLILLGMIVCDVIFLVFGNTLWSDVESNAYEIYENNVVTFQFDTLDIDAFLARTGGREEITSVFFEHRTSGAGNAFLTVAAYEPVLDISRSTMEKGQNLSGKPLEVVVNDAYTRDRYLSDLPLIKKGDVFRFLDDDWVCSGIIWVSAAEHFDMLINMADFKSHVQGAVTANFRYENGTSLVELREFADSLKEEFHASAVTLPAKTVGASFTEFLYEMSGMLVLLVIAIINDMFLYRFLLTKRYYTYGIYKLYGMDNGLTMLGLCVEMLLFLAFSYAFSVVLYWGGQLLLGRGGTVIQHLPEMAFAFIVVAVLNLFFFGITAAKLVRNSPAGLIRESVVS